MKPTYEAPRITELGLVHGLTQQQLEKVGASTDAVSFIIPSLIGSIRPR